MSNVSLVKTTFICFLILTFLLSGCGYRCFDRGIYKPKVISKTEVKVSIEQFNYTVGLYIPLNDSASLSISECTLKPDNLQIEPEKLCLSVRLAETHTFQLKQASVEVSSNSTPNTNLLIGDWEYREESYSFPPTRSVIKPQKEKPGFYSFEASALFSGAPSKWAPPAMRAFSKEMKRREYISSINLPSKLGSRFLLKLPEVFVDGKKYELPIFEFSYETESICSAHA